jgi:hypothetical protein
MGADKLSENTQNAPQNFKANLSTQTQKFGIFEKKTLSVVRALNQWKKSVAFKISRLWCYSLLYNFQMLEILRL